MQKKRAKESNHILKSGKFEIGYKHTGKKWKIYV